MTRSKWDCKKDEFYKLRIEQKLTYPEIAKIYGVTKETIKCAMKRLGIPLLERKKKVKEIKPKRTPKERKIMTCAFCGKEFIERPGRAPGVYCSKECSIRDKRKKLINLWKQGLHNGTSGFTCSDFVRDYMFEKVGYKCERCGWGEVNPFTKRVPLQIHHVDGNSLNNKEENLQVLCPNCHNLTENFGSRNKNAPNGKSQYYRRNKI